ncbi:HNH endonuclease [Glutamicibacter creatinolyticus]|uniref:HNH endonuclease n=1 Tax=Glutamicibacter creatinolyticus TaxID=162496 RepID=UPI003D2F39D4
MAWSTSSRREELPDNWPELRSIVIHRASGRCEARHKSGRRCWDKGTDVDHIRPHAEGGSDELSNLQLLCQWHHGRKSSAEGGRGFQRNYQKLKALTVREAEKHPGVVDAAVAVPRANRGF